MRFKSAALIGPLALDASGLAEPALAAGAFAGAVALAGPGFLAGAALAGFDALAGAGFFAGDFLDMGRGRVRS
ncbi:MAG: hypothetical protein C0502_06625 [Opitutus sp.]|nr:hypothetical protein [Opitutus sp.]